ncbi:hypothetical protein SAMN04487982_1291 [Streptomyces sp. ok210]|jgi:hypothetical protein|nr:hypothetical protein SAMN04487982_1291 [Streptomyces sp. ok210]
MSTTVPVREVEQTEIKAYVRSVLLLDDPFNGMDPRQRMHLMEHARYPRRHWSARVSATPPSSLSRSSSRERTGS